MSAFKPETLLFDPAAERGLVGLYWARVHEQKRMAASAAARSWVDAILAEHGPRLKKEIPAAVRTASSSVDAASAPRVVVHVCKLIVPAGGLLASASAGVPGMGADLVLTEDQGTFATPDPHTRARSVEDLVHLDTALTRHDDVSVGILIDYTAALERLAAAVGSRFVAALSPAETSTPVFGRRVPTRGIELLYKREAVWLTLSMDMKPYRTSPITPRLVSWAEARRSFNPDRTPSFMLLNQAAVADDSDDDHDSAAGDSLDGGSADARSPGVAASSCGKRPRMSVGLHSCDASVVDVVDSDGE